MFILRCQTNRWSCATNVSYVVDREKLLNIMSSAYIKHFTCSTLCITSLTNRLSQSSSIHITLYHVNMSLLCFSRVFNMPPSSAEHYIEQRCKVMVYFFFSSAVGQRMIHTPNNAPLIRCKLSRYCNSDWIGTSMVFGQQGKVSNML